jgi:hypothetical protein
MQVRDLIEELQRFDPMDEVLLTVKWQSLEHGDVTFRESKPADKVQATTVHRLCRVEIVAE